MNDHHCGDEEQNSGPHQVTRYIDYSDTEDRQGQTTQRAGDSPRVSCCPVHCPIIPAFVEFVGPPTKSAAGRDIREIDFAVVS